MSFPCGATLGILGARGEKGNTCLPRAEHGLPVACSLEQILDAGDEEEEEDEESSEETASAASAEDRHDTHAHSSSTAHAAGQQHHQPVASTSGGLRESETMSGQDRRGDHGQAARPGRGGAASKGGAAAVAWRPGRLLEVKGGGSDVQGVLDALEACSGVAVVAWHAAWCETCRAAVPALERCASSARAVFLFSEVHTACCRAHHGDMHLGRLFFIGLTELLEPSA